MEHVCKVPQESKNRGGSKVFDSRGEDQLGCKNKSGLETYNNPGSGT